LRRQLQPDHTLLPALQRQKSRPSSRMKRASTIWCTSEAPSLGIAARAVELDRHVGGVVQGVGDVELRHRDLLARAVALVELPGGAHHQQPADLDVVRDRAELHLHALAVGQLDAEAFALLDIRVLDLLAAGGAAAPAHAVGEPRRPEPDLGGA
jgi:hypothetical protein